MLVQVQKVLHIARQFNPRWKCANEMPVHHMKGNLSFMTNLPEIATLVEEWTWSGDRHYAPKCLEDIREDATFSQILQNCHLEAGGLWMAQTAFPRAFAAEGEVEAGVVGETIDEYDGEDPPSGKDIRDAVLSAEEMLENTPYRESLIMSARD